MSIYNLFRRKYDLIKESKDAGFRGNVNHFRSYLVHCPKHAIATYGYSKYHSLRKQVGLPGLDAESSMARAG